MEINKEKYKRKTIEFVEHLIWSKDIEILINNYDANEFPEYTDIYDYVCREAQLPALSEFEREYLYKRIDQIFNYLN